MTITQYQREAGIVRAGGVGILPTDTLYGLTGSVMYPEAVYRIYELKERDYSKPLIVLIRSIDDLKEFNIKLSVPDNDKLVELWPGPVSVILPCLGSQFEYIHRGTEAIAFRRPNNKDLIDFISETGPIVAPSANPEGFPPARDIIEAKGYFKDKVDFYIDGGHLDGLPSTLVRLENGKIEVVRRGTYEIK